MQGTTSDQRRTRFGDVLTAYAIRAVEREGPLDDAQAMREAARTATTREQQVIERARILAERIGLADDMRRLAAAGPLVALAAALVVMLLTWALLTSVVSDGRQINVVTAFFGVLGPHLASLLVWGLALLRPGSAGLVGQLGRGIGGLAMWLAASRLRLGGRHGPELVREGTEMLRTERLLPWAFGLANHGIWAAAFGLLFPMLLFLFAFRAYQLSWETTILSRDFFIEFIAQTNRLPAALHLPSIDMEALRAPGGPGVDRGLAMWLAGCVLVYGLVPRVLLFAVSLAVWRRRRSSFRLDASDAYFRKLFNRFDRLGASSVVDAERPASAGDRPARTHATSIASGEPVWIAFELPPEVEWPPAGSVPGDGPHERIAGDSAERQRVIERLARQPAARVVVACDGATSPDRGTARFLRDVAAHAGATALLLVERGGRAIDSGQWTDWAAASGLGDVPVFTDVDAAGAWTLAQEQHG